MSSKNSYFMLKTVNCLISAVILLILSSVSAFAVPASGIDAESLIIPTEYYTGSQNTGDIWIWATMDDTDKRLYVKHSVSLAVYDFMSGTDSGDMGFMVLSGWTDKLASEAYGRIMGDPVFVEDTVLRIDMSVAEYFKRRDAVMGTVLCNGAGDQRHCGGCAAYPFPSVWQIAVYQTLMETRSSMSLEA